MTLFLRRLFTNGNSHCVQTTLLSSCSTKHNQLRMKSSAKRTFGDRISDVMRSADIEAITSNELPKILDTNDPLKHLRNEFCYPKMNKLPDVEPSLVNLDEDCIYLCGNSLGLLPKRTQTIIEAQLRKWADVAALGRVLEPFSWEHADECMLDKIAKLVGAELNEVVMMNSLTVNLHMFMTNFYRPTHRRHRILMESDAFPSDFYAVQSQIRLKGFDSEKSLVSIEPRKGEECLRTEDILTYIKEHGDSIAVIFFSGIQYYTGQLFDIKSITTAGHEKGCIVGWDMAHCFGNVPLRLHEWDVDFAVWCTYKYGCSGSGGIGGGFVNKKFEKLTDKRLLGWWSHRFSTRFLMDRNLDLEESALGYRVSCSPMMLNACLLGALEVFDLTTMEDLRAKSLMLTGYLEALINHNFSKHSKLNCSIITPANPEERGCQLSLKFSIGADFIHKELSKRGVNVDKRSPNVIRVAPVHLYNSYSDVYRFVQCLNDSINAIVLLEENQFADDRG